MNWLKKMISAGICISVFAGVLFCTQSVNASPLAFSTERVYGADRIETSIAVSQRGWQSASTVILDEENDYPDALAATPLARQLDAPILLTNGITLDSRVITELQRLKPNKVIVLGGTGIMTSNITHKLDGLNLRWERIGGFDRYDTASMIAKRITSDSVIFVNGENFPDALASATYAGMKQIPVLLTTTQGIPDKIKEVYNEKNPQHVLVVGGTGVVPDSTLSGITIEKRIGGADRYETSAKMYEYAHSVFTSTNTYLASGEVFADAMVGGALAAKEGAPLILTNNSVSPTTYSALSTISTLNTQGKLILLGGTGAISSTAQQILEGKVPPTYVLEGKTIVVDAGHGTPDSGAIGPSGTKEKDNNLAIALYLANSLQLNGAHVILTRTTDQAPTGSGYVQINDLQARVDIANNAKADLFVSIHNDSFGSSASGTSSWYSSNNEYGQANESYLLASYVQRELTSYLGTYDRGVRDANYYVNNHTAMPSVLVEVAFISNPTEEKQLADPTYRRKAAEGITQGIIDYFWQQ